MPLTRDQIVDAAIRILDAEGPEALSMRRLGAELDAGAATVYWHVRSKDELLDLVADRVIGEVFAAIGEAGDWRAWMAGFARSMRRVLLAHRGVAGVVGSRVTAGPNATAALDRLLGLLASDGFDATSSILASTTLVGWTTALVLAEAREAAAGGSVAGAAALATGGDARLRAVLDATMSLTADVRFDYGLEVLLAGIEAREHRRREGAGDWTARDQASERENRSSRTLPDHTEPHPGPRRSRKRPPPPPTGDTL